MSAFGILRFGYTVLPIVAGIDKFTMALYDWHEYLAPWVENLLPFEDPHVFMYGVGVVEIAAGLIVAFKPRIGGWIVFLWLLAITGNMLGTEHLDIALRDFGLALGALALARLAAEREVSAV